MKVGNAIIKELIPFITHESNAINLSIYLLICHFWLKFLQTENFPKLQNFSRVV